MCGTLPPPLPPTFALASPLPLSLSLPLSLFLSLSLSLSFFLSFFLSLSLSLSLSSSRRLAIGPNQTVYLSVSIHCIPKIHVYRRQGCDICGQGVMCTCFFFLRQAHWLSDAASSPTPRLDPKLPLPTTETQLQGSVAACGWSNTSEDICVRRILHQLTGVRDVQQRVPRSLRLRV